MVHTLFVGNLHNTTTDSQLEKHFERIGNVLLAKVIIDRYTGQGKGYGFVEMETAKSAQDAISKLNGSLINGRTIAVTKA
jgi:cold-inducible RNA-binding protein